MVSQKTWGFVGFPTSLGTPRKAECARSRGSARVLTAPWWRPDRLAARRGRIAARGRILVAMREFFAAHGYVEVETPALQVSPGLEPHLRAFATVLHDPRDAGVKPRYLHTSPEFAMKKLVAGGLPRIWQLARVFRDGERGAAHHPEFAISDPAHPDAALLAAAAARTGIAPHPGDDWESLFFRVFLDRIEPNLGIGAPTILYDYPIAMAALARAKPDDPRLAERFELYVCGLELANAFGELTDATEQRRRFQADQARKQALYGEIYPIDEDFLAALDHGMPACAGIALGFDRLVMLATEAEHIEEVLWAPVC
jgi:elongation factor P--(R)-beta-lysine ligase